MSEDRQVFWAEDSIQNLPTGPRGLVNSLALYTKDPEWIITQLQNHLHVTQTGKCDPETCTKVQEVLQLKGSIAFLNELNTLYGKGNTNGVRYRASQFGFETNGKSYSDNLDTLFCKDRYGEVIKYID